MSESETTVDVVALGMGPGGEDVAGHLAEAGLSVVGIEAGLVGGECPYWGCIPSKMMIRAAHLLAEARRIPGVAGSSSVTADWEPVAARIRAEATDNWNDKVAVDRFVDKGGTFVRGRGRLAAADTVEVDGYRYTATRAVVVATGTTAAVPPIPGLADTPFWTNREAVEVATLPSSIIVLGGGAIGAELTQVYARFGVNVTIVEALDRLLPLEEPEAGEILSEVLTAEGVSVITGTAAANVSHDGSFHVTLNDGTELAASELLIATGRCVDLGGIGADSIGVDITAKALPVDDHLRVTDGVWAVGDVTGKGAFTHVAMYQSKIIVADILGKPHTPADYAALPSVTFTDPEVGSVGMTAAAAREAGIDVMVGRSQVPYTARGWLHKVGNEGFIQLVADRNRGVLVGATSMGPNGGEVLGLLTLAVHARTPIEELRSMIYAYPTFHRGIEDALGQFA
jgi:pyruvate/2-oxoglutarate dehydrogenase complex dihydrolipoamide dehydrogenase (E3) component